MISVGDGTLPRPPHEPARASYSTSFPVASLLGGYAARSDGVDAGSGVEAARSRLLR
jgi:hypothetical protein